MNAVLIGYRGCGKTTVGRAMAARLGWSFVDTDEIIQARAGMTIREILAGQGESGFRELEARAVEEAAGLDRQVIGTGGGAVLREENVRLLRSSGKLVYLKAPPEVLWKRIVKDTARLATRPQISPADELPRVSQALIERDPLYQRVADCIVDTSSLTVDNIVEQIITLVGLQAS